MAPTWLPAVLPDADGADLVLPAGRILQVAAESDFLVVCSQLTDETRRFISAPVFAVMKPDAVLINVARGEERLFADNLRRYLDGQPLRNEVDRTRG
jgi:phosphoglycerate dehydrogenase-like enzyme